MSYTLWLSRFRHSVPKNVMGRHPGPRGARPKCKLRAGHPGVPADGSLTKFHISKNMEIWILIPPSNASPRSRKDRGSMSSACSSRRGRKAWRRAISRALDVPANTLSAQLLVLSNGGLVRARRDGRSIIYAINFEAMRDLLVFLTEDCCGGRAEMCAPLAGIASRAICSKAKRGEQHEAPARACRRR